jgi:hypothetical protein
MKVFNDRFGRIEGDAFIASTARMLQETFRERDIIGRVGGVEFAVLVAGEAEGLAAHLERNVVSLASAGKACLISARIGVARCGPEDKASLEQLIVNANGAIPGERISERRVSLFLRKRRRRVPVWRRSQGEDRFRGPGVHRRSAFSLPRSSPAEECPGARRLEAVKRQYIPFTPRSQA